LSYGNNFTDGSYKFAELEVMRDYDMVNIQIRTNDLLMFLGDIGGLSGILAQIGVILLGYTQFASFFANNFFVSKLYVAKRRFNEDIS
jgi:hypothetical protein